MCKGVGERLYQSQAYSSILRRTCRLDFTSSNIVFFVLYAQRHCMFAPFAVSHFELNKRTSSFFYKNVQT